MSRLAELIEELCPDGVEYRPLGELVRIRNGRDYKTLSSGIVPVYGSGGVMTHVSEALGVGPTVLIPRKGSLDNIFFVEGEFWTVDTIFYTEIGAELEPKFFYYNMKTMRLSQMNEAAGVPSMNQRKLGRIRIPVPPLEVQREIVRILDQFTTLEAELEAELEARQAQYADYQNRLLFPGNCDFLREVGAKVSLGDIASISKNRIAAEYLDETNFVGVDNLISDRRGRVDSQYSPTSGSMTAFSKGDILIGNIRPYLRKVWFSDRDGGCSGDVVALTLKPEWKDRVSPRFLYYVVSSVRFFDFYQATARGGSIPRGDKKKLLFFSFIVPCKQEQEHIVMTLDRFEELINDISSGLPAEIEARRTQYEYYRERLLSFPEKPAD